jgi:biopolymer transport protein ExbD
MLFRRRRRFAAADFKAEDSNMTPMIDVVFQLLIFFMLSMHFKEVEGKLLSQLPKTKGLESTPVPQPQLPEVRVILCAGRDTATHLHDKGRHEKADKDGTVCAVLVDRHSIGEVYKTGLHPGKAAANKGVYAALGAKAKELHALQPVDPLGRPVPVILDADSEVPYEHIIGAVNACKAAGVEAIEFVGNPRHEKYYGSFQKGQFRR